MEDLNFSLLELEKNPRFLLERDIKQVTISDKDYFSDNGVPCLVNDKPTNYLCNYAYHKVLQKNINTIFIHVPELKNIKDLDKLINLISNINITTCI